MDALVFSVTEGVITDWHKVEKEYTLDEVIEWAQQRIYRDYVFEKTKPK